MEEEEEENEGGRGRILKSPLEITINGRRRRRRVETKGFFSTFLTEPVAHSDQ